MQRNELHRCSGDADSVSKSGKLHGSSSADSSVHIRPRSDQLDRDHGRRRGRVLLHQQVVQSRRDEQQVRDVLLGTERNFSGKHFVADLPQSDSSSSGVHVSRRRRHDFERLEDFDRKLLQKLLDARILESAVEKTMRNEERRQPDDRQLLLLRLSFDGFK